MAKKNAPARTCISLTDDEKARAARLAEHYGLRGLTAIVRFLVKKEERSMEVESRAGS